MCDPPSGRQTERKSWNADFYSKAPRTRAARQTAVDRQKRFHLHYQLRATESHIGKQDGMRTNKGSKTDNSDGIDMVSYWTHGQRVYSCTPPTPRPRGASGLQGRRANSQEPWERLKKQNVKYALVPTERLYYRVQKQARTQVLNSKQA